MSAFDPFLPLGICENAVVADGEEVAFFSKSSRPPNPNGVAANFVAVFGSGEVRIVDELRSSSSNGLPVPRVGKGAHVTDRIIDRRLQRLLVLRSIRACVVSVRFKLLLMQQRSKGGRLRRRRGGAATCYDEEEG